MPQLRLAELGWLLVCFTGPMSFSNGWSESHRTPASLFFSSAQPRVMSLIKDVE